MRTLTIIATILLFATISFSQSKDEIRLKEIDAEIIKKEKDVIEAQMKKENLLKSYKEKHPDIVELSSKIDNLQWDLIALKKEKNEIMGRKFLANLPNNQIELLKIIIRQNQEIIELLKNRPK